MKKTVIINRGIPASGKSTFTKEILTTLNESNISVVSCSTDDYFIVEGKYTFDTSKLREYHLRNQQKFNASLKDGIEVVICDNTNIEPWEAKPYYEMAKEFDYRVVLIDFESRNIEEHCAAQNNKGYNRNIDEDILSKMHQSLEDYKELTAKHSYPSSSKTPKRDYDEVSKQVKAYEEPSEPFYYDDLIKIASADYMEVKNIIGTMILKKMRDYVLDEIVLIPQHYKTIMTELEKKQDKTLTAYDLERSLNKSPKQIERYMQELQSEFHNIIGVRVGRRKGYKLIDTFDVFVEAFKNFNKLDELMYLAAKSNPELFEKMQYTINKNKSPHIFKGHIFESVTNYTIFENLKKAINNNEYREIKFFDNSEKLEVKCIKFVFIDNNWYLAYVDSNDVLKLGRVSFIEEVNYASKISYQVSSVKKHLESLSKDLQNSLTLFDQTPKEATIKANANIAKYFKKDMKKFLSSQRFKEDLDDGSVHFTLKYTQELEILPFIQRWMPDLTILSPIELRNAYVEKLSQASLNHK